MICTCLIEHNIHRTLNPRYSKLQLAGGCENRQCQGHNGILCPETHGRELGLGGFFRTSILRRSSAHPIDGQRSGLQHEKRTARRCRVNVRLRVLPSDKQLFSLGKELLWPIKLALEGGICISARKTRPFLPVIRHMSVGLEKRSDIQGLPSPKMAVDSPVKRQLQRPSVERPAGRRSQVSTACSMVTVVTGLPKLTMPLGV